MSSEPLDVKDDAVSNPTPTDGAFRPTPDDAVRLFRQFFLNRTDRVCFEATWKSGKNSPCPLAPDDEPHLDAILRAHVDPTAPPVDFLWCKEGLPRERTGRGRYRLGTYAPDVEGLTRWACVDCDGGSAHGAPLANPLRAARDVLRVLRDAGLVAHLELSKSGKGWHVWILFTHPLPACAVRRVLLNLLLTVEAKLADDEGDADILAGRGLELFPKGDAVGEVGVGLQCWLPWFGGATGNGNLFHRVVDGGGLEPFLPDDFATNDAAALARLDPQVTEPEGTTRDAEGCRPGDLYNRDNSAGWPAPDGWEMVRRLTAGGEQWRRPGKTQGISATAGVVTSKSGVPLFCCFTSSAPPLTGAVGGRVCTSYDRLGLLAAARFNGNITEAVRWLAANGYGTTRGARPSRNGHTGAGNDHQGDRPFEVTLGALTLRPVTPHRTKGGKLVCPVVAFKDGSRLAELHWSNSANGRREAVAELQRLGFDGGRDAAEGGFHRVFVWAGERVDAPPSGDGDGPPMLDVCRARVSDELRLCRTPEGRLWSDTLGVELSRHEFECYCPAWLKEACATCPDAPEDTVPFGKAVQYTLRTLWPELLAVLPLPHAAPLRPDGKAAARFRSELVNLWTIGKLMESIDKDRTARASLASKSRHYLQSACQTFRPSDTPTPTNSWQEVHTNVDAWWRLWVGEQGECQELLAMRWTLAAQIGVSLSWVRDQNSLRELGLRFGCFDPEPPVTSRLTGGERLCVLSCELTRAILAQPDKDDKKDNAG